MALRALLSRHQYQVAVAPTAEAGLSALEHFDPDFVLADVRMPGMGGLALCEQLRAQGSRATVIVMSAYGSLELALDAMKAGA